MNKFKQFLHKLGFVKLANDQNVVPVEMLDIEESLIDSLSQTDSVKSLTDEVVCEMSDCGGQPQFLEILPRFVSDLAIAIVVINLRERLDEYPTSYLYGKDGERVGEGERSKLTNEQLLRQFLQVVIS